MSRLATSLSHPRGRNTAARPAGVPAHWQFASVGQAHPLARVPATDAAHLLLFAGPKLSAGFLPWANDNSPHVGEIRTTVRSQSQDRPTLTPSRISNPGAHAPHWRLVGP